MVSSRSDSLPTFNSLTVLGGISLVHLLNDSMQAVIPAMFPILETSLRLSYSQLGLVAFANNMIASFLQPMVGFYTDKRPSPYLLPFSMLFSMAGIFWLGYADSVLELMAAVALLGVGTSVFHPEGSRLVVIASGERRGLGQSLFQVLGQAGQALAPVWTVVVFSPLGQRGALLFVAVALIAVVILTYLANWYQNNLNQYKVARPTAIKKLPRKRRELIYYVFALIILVTFARSCYQVGIIGFYSFFQTKVLSSSLEEAQSYVFIFLVALSLGTLHGGSLADHMGLRNVLWLSASISGLSAVLLPFTDSWAAYAILFVSGYAIMAGFPVSLIYCLELLPERIGLVSGIMFGLAFGSGALAAVVLGMIGDWLGIQNMMTICCSLPLLGLLVFFLPVERSRRRR
ncbi:MAG: MFS transporter [Cytophagales bacterium]|nr:MFS transporter [Bernardetiaceae bacterium]MDW8210711.1 MFS transporter [Cytophagales bacterium]